MMQKVDILKAGINDISEIVKIEEKYIPDGWSEKAFSHWLENKNTIIFKAVIQNKIIGFINGSFVLDEGELLNIAVEEQYRILKTGSLLFEYLENYFKEMNVSKIFLEVREKNTSAIGFYLKHGFEKNGLIKNYYNNPKDNGILMMKNI